MWERSSTARMKVAPSRREKYGATSRFRRHAPKRAGFTLSPGWPRLVLDRPLVIGDGAFPRRPVRSVEAARPSNRERDGHPPDQTDTEVACQDVRTMSIRAMEKLDAVGGERNDARPQSPDSRRDSRAAVERPEQRERGRGQGTAVGKAADRSESESR